MFAVRLLWILLFVGCGSSDLPEVRGDYFNRCPNSNSETATAKLRDSLLCMYDENIRPVADHKNTTVMTFRIILKHFFFHIMTSTVAFDVWLTVSWKDQHLTWKPSEHENIDTIHLHTNEIWTPDLSIYNSANQGDNPSIMGNTMCRISSAGVVVCIPAVQINALCVPDLSRYPFDVHDCSLRLGSWIHKGEELDLRLAKNPVDVKDMVPNGEWGIKSVNTVKNPGVYKCCPNDTFPSIQINFKIERIPGGHAANIVIPSVVLIILTFAMLALSPLVKERLIIGYVNLIAQFLQIQSISYQIPLKGDNIPMLVLFARDSLFLSVFAIVFTLIFKKIMETKSIAPAWISAIVSCVIACKPGQIILLNDYSVRGVASAKGEEDGTTIVNSESNETSQDWMLFAKILDKLFFLSYIIVYFIMIIAFWP